MQYHISVAIDGKTMSVPKGSTVKRALELAGYRFTKYPEKGAMFAPCETGGCWSCAVYVGGELEPACTTLASEAQTIRTIMPDDRVPKRIITGFSGHPVGGVGTPWWLKSAHGYIEVACFAAGCNFHCPQCQNWDITYKATGKAMSPIEAAERMTASRKTFGVDRMAISGGESTLNRRWLLQFVRELRRLNPDPAARIHVDTNTSILTRDYIDELVAAGMTDVGPDLKGNSPETFMRITGVEDVGLAKRYLNTAWEAVRYLNARYRERVFVGVGIPYNRELISPDEIGLMGERLFEIDPELQVCVLDYRPEYKRPELVKPSYGDMAEIHQILRGKGLETVICQTQYGHIGPGTPPDLR